MKSVGALMLLLLCLCEAGAQGQRDDHGEADTLVQPDLWEELKFVRDLVTDLQMELATTKHEMEEMSSELTASQQQVELLQTRLSTSEEQVQNLTSEGEGHGARLSSVETRLTDVEGTSNPNHNQKVGFSASLTDRSYGPADPETIVFNDVFINNGNAYNKDTGVFTAPQKGAYLLTFSTLGDSPHYSGALLMKNGQVQLATWIYEPDRVSTSATVIVSLNVGDRVYVETRGGSYQVHGSSLHFTTFSGVLLYTL